MNIALYDNPTKVAYGAAILPCTEDFGPIYANSQDTGVNFDELSKIYPDIGSKNKIISFPDIDGRHLLVYAGLGKKGEINAEIIRSAYAEAIHVCAGFRKKNIALFSPEIPNGNIAVREISFTARLSLYKFTKFKEAKNDLSVENIYIISKQAKNEDVVYGDIVGSCVNVARDLANMPASSGTPTYFVNEAKKIVGIETEVLDRSDFINLGMGGLEAVSRGSSEPPKLLIMKYTPVKSQNASPIILVGKGITFDSGGISIKPSENLANLKFDKSGAAAVFGTIAAISSLRLSVNVIGLLPLTENMPDGNAYKPGDVIKHYNGITSEIISTDAEGRLVLADALAYGIERFSPRAAIDIATLTGAKVVALGNNIGALMGNDNDLIQLAIKASENTWERIWQLPLDEEFSDQIESEIADIKNTGGRAGGAETAGAFLKHFVGNVPWIHIDMHGKSEPYGQKKKAYLPDGASGFGVRLLVEIISSIYSK